VARAIRVRQATAYADSFHAAPRPRQGADSLSMREDPSTTFFTYDPSGRDAVNSGAPWSAQVDADLLWMIDEHRGVSTIAQFLCRTEREVRERARQLGHLLGRGTGKRRARS
jgi:hypothetical protein